MDFFAQVDRAAELVLAHGRVSRRGLAREFGIDGEAVDDVAEELVVRGVAQWQDEVLVSTTAGSPAPAGPTETGELRHLTVMFCDVVASTELSGELDAEVWSHAMRAFHDVAGAAIETWGGHVGNYMGDGLVAYFGYPVAQEDAAERAVRAGLEMVDRLPGLNETLESSIGRAIEIRVGIHTGPVVVDEFGGVVQAMGETANIAARLEGAAPPDGVVISPITRRLVSGVFVTADLGEQSLKGIAGPMAITQAMRVGGVAPRLGAGRTDRTPLVGRDLELGLLADRWQQVREGWGQIVVVTGEAGIGKSRLVDTFRESLENQPHSWLDVACSPYAQSAALFPLAELQRRGLGFAADATPEVKRDAIYGALDIAGLDGERAVGLLSELHGLQIDDPLVSTMSPEHRRIELFDLLIDWIIALARLQPTVLFLDDLHWADPTTLEVLERLVDQVATEQLFVIVTARPDRPPKWTAHSNITPLQLSRMTREQTAKLAVGAAGSDLDADLVASIVQRSDGVPLFAEELAVALARHPGGDMAVPATLHDLLMARLEQLGPLREVAQMASIVGREFQLNEVALLSAVDDSELERLVELGVREELFYRRGTAPDLAYMFKHALMRDAVYESMLSTTRQAHHLRFATAFVETQGQLAANRPDLVAEHLALGNDPGRATKWWERAADAAASAAAGSEAEHFYRKAVETADRTNPDRLISLKLGLAGVVNSTRGYGHPDLMPLWDEVIALAGESGVDRSLEMAHTGRSLGLAISGDFSGARQDLANALKTANTSGETDTIAACQAVSMLMHTFEGRPHQAIETATALVTLGKSSRQFDRTVGLEVMPNVIAYRGYSEFICGRFAASARSFDTALAAATEWNTPTTRANIGILMAGMFGWRGDLQLFINENQVLEELSGRFGLTFFGLMGQLNVAALTAITAGDETQLAKSWDLLAELTSTGSLVATPLFLMQIGFAELACGFPERTISTVDSGLAIAEQTSQRFADPQLVALRVRAAHQLGDPGDNWRDDLENAWDFAEERSLRVGALELATTKARLLARTSDHQDGLDTLRDAIDQIPEPDGAPVIDEAETLFASLNQNEG